MVRNKKREMFLLHVEYGRFSYRGTDRVGRVDGILKSGNDTTSTFSENWGLWICVRLARIDPISSYPVRTSQ